MSRFSLPALIRRVGGVFLLLTLVLFTIILFGDLMSMALSPDGREELALMFQENFVSVADVSMLVTLVCWLGVGIPYSIALVKNPIPIRQQSVIQVLLYALVIAVLAVAMAGTSDTAPESGSSSDEPMLGIIGLALILAPAVVPLLDLLLPPYRSKKAALGEIFA